MDGWINTHALLPPPPLLTLPHSLTHPPTNSFLKRQPLDMDTIRASLSRTHKLAILDESTSSGGVGATISALVNVRLCPFSLLFFSYYIYMCVLFIHT